MIAVKEGEVIQPSLFPQADVSAPSKEIVHTTTDQQAKLLSALSDIESTVRALRMRVANGEAATAQGYRAIVSEGRGLSGRFSTRTVETMLRLDGLLNPPKPRVITRSDDESMPAPAQ